MPKRKIEEVEDTSRLSNGKTRRITEITRPIAATHIHLITGSYERALHGIIATIPLSILDASNVLSSKDNGTNDTLQELSGEIGPNATARNGTLPEVGATTLPEKERNVDEVTFADSFLFNAHTSAIRCLAISPIPGPSDAQQKVILATGSTDERVNLYHISPSPPRPTKKGEIALPSLSGASISQNPRNRELGALLHHAGAITALFFPTRSKLLSAAEDNTIAVSRSRDWTVLSTIKAPIPKPVGRPSGDTAGPGEVPAGVNDFAVHPSMKLMLSVGKGERSMRLWNLVTGKKAGVLNFERDVLQQVGEGKYGSGEGRRILWDATGSEFAVGFERGACIYNIDCEPQARILPTPLTKVHQMHYVQGLEPNVLAVSTEDGRILFYNTKPAAGEAETTTLSEATTTKTTAVLPAATLIAELGGQKAELTTRIKDFEILPLAETDGSAPAKSIVVTAGSDGTVRLWFLLLEELQSQLGNEVLQVGQVLAKYDTGNRITCLKAFVMTQLAGEDSVESEVEENGVENGGASSSDSDDSD